nr:unnamed protein product [Callosobruchus chinensis]
MGANALDPVFLDPNSDLAKLWGRLVGRLGENLEVDRLWRVKSKEYHYREKRDASYAKLLLKLKELEPDATTKSVVAKINSLRSNVRKEKKKRDMSIKSGASADNVYVSKLWYLDLFDFLGDQDIPSTSVSNLEEEYEEINDSAGTPSNATPINGDEIPPPAVARSNSSTGAVGLLPTSRPNLAKKRKSEELTNDVLVSVRDHFKKPVAQDDRYDLMGKSFAMRIRALEKREALIVEKRINDLLFEAEMGMLNPHSSELLNSSSNSSRSTPTPSSATSYGQFSQQTSPGGFANEGLPPSHSMAAYFSSYSDH